MIESLKILATCILGAVFYGICHDLITTRVCVEYFTIGHPPVWGGTEDPMTLAFTWGVIATWWVGAFLSIPTILASRAGSLPKLSAAQLLKPIGCLLIVMAIGSLSAGLIGYQLAQAEQIRLFEPFASSIPSERHSLFLADLWAHNAAYTVGFFGGLSICGWIWITRRNLHSETRTAHESTSTMKSATTN